jgi:hypothetical protein
MTNDVTITRNIFGPKLSPDGLDWLTMAKWKKYTGAWPAMVEKLRYIRYGVFFLVQRHFAFDASRQVAFRPVPSAKPVLLLDLLWAN